MKITFTAALLALALAGCATTDSAEDAVTAAPEAAATADSAAAPEAAPDCDPGDEDCDHTGTVFRPPTQR